MPVILCLHLISLLRHCSSSSSLFFLLLLYFVNCAAKKPSSAPQLLSFIIAGEWRGQKKLGSILWPFHTSILVLLCQGNDVEMLVRAFIYITLFSRFFLQYILYKVLIPVLLKYYLKGGKRVYFFVFNRRQLPILLPHSFGWHSCFRGSSDGGGGTTSFESLGGWGNRLGGGMIGRVKGNGLNGSDDGNDEKKDLTVFVVHPSPLSLQRGCSTKWCMWSHWPKPILFWFLPLYY